MKHLFLSIVLLGTTSLLQPALLAAGYLSVPLVRVIANPEKFDNKRISTSGVAREFTEGKWILYLDCESAKAEAIENGIEFLVDAKSKLSPVASRMSLRFVLVQALFREGPRGGGHLEDVDDVTTYPLLREAGQSDAEVCKP